ncbi:MAG: signal transduction histidine kinase [Paracrocinitomix sp.]|jgi:signal transduction histidine kinase
MTEPALGPVDEQLEIVAVERERIAGELHDDSVQAMTAVSLQLQRLQARVDDENDRALVEQARKMADEAIERLRHMLFVLHPSSLEDDGLFVTLEVYLETYVDAEGIDWTVKGEQNLDLPLGVSALAFRLAREAISNAIRHASPSRVAIMIDEIDQHLIVAVRDDGSGFEVGEHKLKAGHLGLIHGRALAEAALGTYDIVSAIGAGTTVTIQLPITEPV